MDGIDALGRSTRWYFSHMSSWGDAVSFTGKERNPTSAIDCHGCVAEMNFVRKEMFSPLLLNRLRVIERCVNRRRHGSMPALTVSFSFSYDVNGGSDVTSRVWKTVTVVCMSPQYRRRRRRKTY